MSSGKISEFISCIITAVSACSLYSEEHEIVSTFSEKSLGLLDDLYREDTFSIIMLGNSLLVNDEPYAEKGIHIDNLIKRFKRKKIEKIVIRKKPDPEEFRKFIVSLASRDKVLSSPFISVGILDVSLSAEGLDVSMLFSEGMTKIQEAFYGVPKLKALDMVSIEGAVADFITLLKKELNVLRMISPVKNHNEYTHIHASNVALVTMFQAETIGLKGENLYDAGVAGLLHDVGKLFVSISVLDKKENLDEDEWSEMQKHPSHGALYLLKLPNVPPVAIIAAFEHHMKFDGSGYPVLKRKGKKQHIVSQMVALADFYDALRTERPYRESLDLKTTIGFMREGAGKDFNPLLVDNFIAAIAKISDK